MYGRRQVLKGSLAGAGLLALSPQQALSRAAARRASDRIVLGRTGVRCSFLAQGTGFHGWAGASDQTRLGQAGFTRLLRHAIDEGVNFVDMADQYGSHPFVREAVKGVPRDDLVLLSKLHLSGSARGRRGVTGESLDRFRRELGTERIDVCLIHCVTDEGWLEDFARVRDDLAAQKEKGVLRAVGVSCHDHGALKRAAADPWVDVIFARINHRGGSEYSCDDTREEIAKTLRRARANGKAVVGMKIFGAGKLTSPADREASLRYVLGSGLVDAVTIGMTTAAQVDDTMTRVGAALAS
jgi:aryl-alcohol dehydrogenase-like predicted oxidoreductase